MEKNKNRNKNRNKNGGEGRRVELVINAPLILVNPRILDCVYGLDKVSWSPSITALSHHLGWPMSTTHDVWKRLRDTVEIRVELRLKQDGIQKKEVAR